VFWENTKMPAPQLSISLYDHYHFEMGREGVESIIFRMAIRRGGGMEKNEPNQTFKKILLVDDNAPFRTITRKILEKAGYVVFEAANGGTAVLLMKEQPDLVLQDLILPDIAGYDLVVKLRALSENPELPILAFSGFLAKPDQPWDTSAGFNALLVKPVPTEELLEAVKIHLG
jgi:CheY-like chemotaxis protein